MSRERSTLAGLVLCAGILLTQLAWVVAIAPFGGMDEFDHSYRAASVARGHWAPPHIAARHGHGELIPVPGDIVRAAHHACKQLPYTGHDNCSPASDSDAAGEVLAASAAARYNPVYYWLVGTAARTFGGVVALYIMRAGSVALCDVFLFAAIFVAMRRAASPWAVSGLLVCLTPMAVYSTSIVAPNGLQATASILMWCAGGLLVFGEPRRSTVPLVLTGAGAAVSLLVHSTGPIWTPLALLSLLALVGRRRLIALAARNRPSTIAAASLVTLSAIASVIWILVQGTNDPSQDPPKYGSPSLVGLGNNMLLWLFQTIASIPFRNQPAPPLVYAIGVCAFAFVMVLAWRVATGRQRFILMAVSLASLVIPVVLTMVTFDRLGYAWQGRYALPLQFGLVLLSCWICEFQRVRRRMDGIILPMAAVAFATTQAVEVLHAAKLESPYWRGQTPHLAVALPTTLAVVGGLLVLTSVLMRERHDAVAADALVPQETPA